MASTHVTTQNGFAWQEIAADRQNHREKTIAKIEPFIGEIDVNVSTDLTELTRKSLNAREVEITELLAEHLVRKLAEGCFTSVEVTKAFLRRAVAAQRLTNCITELLPIRALKRAADLDRHIATHGVPIGPLHGLPISVKEHIGMKGLDLNAGFIGWVGRVAEEDAHILEILWRSGAVFYVRTTQPQSLMHLETSSNIYGVTTNAFNTTLTSGGSSGGEGALIGLRGSCLGIGTDIGGSIRSPAACNGLYGFKPTTLRLPVGGWAATMAGAEQILATIGPLSTSLRGIEMFTKTIIDAKPWLRDPSLVPLEWKSIGPVMSTTKKLKIAVLWDDEVVRPHPPVTRALHEMVAAMKDSSHVEVVQWKPYKHDLAWEIIANLYFCDGAAQERAAIEISSEPYRRLTDFIIKENPHLQDHTITSMWESTTRRDAYRKAYAELWNSTATSSGPNGEPLGTVDAILCPALPSAAPKLDTARYWSYTAQWNLLDYPAIVFPVSKVSAIDDSASPDFEPRNQKDAYNWHLWEDYGADGYMNAPVCLQLVGRRYEDEKLLKILQELEGFFASPRRAQE